MSPDTKPAPTFPKTMRLFLIFSFLTLQFTLYTLQLSAQRVPNILFIVVDDQGFADVGIDGRSWDVNTPGMDRLAESGVRFSQSYASSPICSASRCGLITGVYQERQGNYWFGGPGLPNKEIPTLAEKLKEAGYKTAYIGKHHYGQGDSDIEHRNFPLNHGFDYFFGFSSSRKHYLIHNEAKEKAFLKIRDKYQPEGRSLYQGAMWENTEKVDVKGFSTEIIGERARTYMAENKDQPFYLHLSFNAVHNFTHQLPKSYLKEKGLKGYYDYNPAVHDYISYYIGGRKPHNPEGRQLYLGQLHFLDLEISRILDFLQEEGLRENTLIAYISDNGGSTPIYANNDPLRGSKYTLYEGGIRVPMILSWPGGGFQAGIVSDTVVSGLDLFPTICASAGVQYGAVDGIDLLPLLTGENNSLGHEVLVWDINYETAVRKGTWKLKTANDIRHANRQQLDVRVGEYLYDLEADPGENRDVRYFFPEKFEELKAIHAAWRKEMEASEGT